MKPLKIVNLLIIVLIIFSIVLSIYLFFFRKEYITKDTIKYDRVLLDDVSNVEAEKLTYDKVEKVNSNNKLQEEYYNYYADKSFTGFKRLLKVVNNNLEFKEEDLKRFVPVIYADNDQNFDSKLLIENIKLFTNSYDVNLLILDISLQNTLEDYYKLIEGLKTIDGLKVGVFLTQRTAEFENYTVYKPAVPNFTKIVDIPRISTTVDFFYIQTYDYTPERAALPGPNNVISELEDSIQYYIYKGLPREKILVGINKAPLSWEDRYYESNIKNNYLAATIQGNVYDEDLAKVTNLKESEIMDSYGYYQKDDKKYIVVFASNKLELAIKSVAQSYGLNGIFYRY